MALDRQVDVVIVGFGASGAAAASAAADSGARVLVLDRGAPGGRRLFASRSRADLREAALAAGVEVRTQCRVHELVVSGGQVCGVGYAQMPARSVASTVHRWLRRMEGRAPAGLASLLGRAADAVSGSRFLVREVRCSSVVLAMDPLHWEFVGPAVWMAATAWPPSQTARHRRLSVVPSVPSGDRPTPELAVRAWCASRDATASAAGPQAELRVDETSGAVLMSGGRPVPGLYSAVRLSPGDARTGREVAWAAPERAGRCAATASAGSLRPLIHCVI